MEKILGIGGVFFKAGNNVALADWYKTRLGVDLAFPGGAVFLSQGAGEMTVWAAKDRNTTDFNPSPTPFMINYRVANLSRMLDQLRAMGEQVEGTTQLSEYGNFGWVMDPEGNRVELWEPPAQ